MPFQTYLYIHLAANVKHLMRIDSGVIDPRMRGENTFLCEFFWKHDIV